MNPHSNETEITILGVVYPLRASFKGLVEIEQRAGMGLFGLMAKMFKSEISIQHVAAIIYGGLKGADALKKGDKVLSFDDVCEMCHKHGLLKLLKPAGEFLALALQGDDQAPKAEEEKKV